MKRTAVLMICLSCASICFQLNMSFEGYGAKIIRLYKILRKRSHLNHYRLWLKFYLHQNMAPDPHGIITRGHNNKTARTVAIREGKKINAPALMAMFKQIIANNRAGGGS
jgi:hypothetical protein